MAIICSITFLFLCVFGRIFYIQIVWGEELQEKAIDQWTREIPIISRRGKIVDRNGVNLAINDDTYTVFVRKKAVKNIKELSTVLSKTLRMDYDYVYNRLTTTISSEITIKKQVKKAQLNELLAFNESGVYYSRDNSRIYPYGDFLSQILGFTSSDGLGQAGLELYYDKYLKGVKGEILYETDIVGVEIENSTPSYIPATDGLNIKLTIDYEIQNIVETVLLDAYNTTKAKRVECVVLNPQNGEILALSTKPSINLNDIDRNDLNSLYSLTRNTIFSNVYEPGSTFKIVTTAINLEEYLNGNKKAYSPSYVFNSSRYRYIDGTRVKCWSDHKNGKHSSLNISGALNNSCNPIFVDMAMSLGKTTMYGYIEKFGFGKLTGVDFSGESQGMILPESAVTSTDLSRISFGQTIAVTPIQLASAVASAVNGGYYYSPRLVNEIYSKEGIICEKIDKKLQNRTISQKASNLLNSMLEDVVSNGSGKNAYIKGYKVAGKTGTAQKYENGVIAVGKYVSSFVGYFPSNKPEYLALVIVDEPVGAYYGSTVVAPYAKEIFNGIISAKNIAPVE